MNLNNVYRGTFKIVEEEIEEHHGNRKSASKKNSLRTKRMKIKGRRISDNKTEGGGRSSYQRKDDSHPALLWKSNN